MKILALKLKEIFLVILILLFTSSLVYAKQKTVVSEHGLSFNIIDTLHKKDNNLYYGIDGSSINVQAEETIVDLKTYTDNMIEKFKKGYSSYNILTKTDDIISGYNAIVLTGSFKYKSKKSDIDMEFTTIVFNLYGEKIIATIAFPKTISKSTKKKLLDIKKSFAFLGNKKQSSKENKKLIDVKLNLYKNKKDNYELLIPNNYKLKKDGLFVNQNSKVIGIVIETSDLDLKEYLNLYIKKLKKSYKKLSVLEESSERKNGFSVLFVKISTDKQKIYNIFYKKNNMIYILTSNGENINIVKIKNSFKTYNK